MSEETERFSRLLPPDGTKVSEWCRKTHIQLCHCCDDLDCGDNMSRQFVKNSDGESPTDIFESSSYSKLLLFTAKELCDGLTESEFKALGKTTRDTLVQLALYSGSTDSPWLPRWTPKKEDFEALLPDSPQKDEK